jgi:hypothetical protein
VHQGGKSEVVAANARQERASNQTADDHVVAVTIRSAAYHNRARTTHHTSSQASLI